MRIPIKQNWFREANCKEVNGPRIACAEQMARVFRELLSRMDPLEREQEHIWCVLLDARHAPKQLHLVTIGGWSTASLDPRVVLRLCLVHGCGSFIIVHNHPSGDPSPSREDIELAARTKRAAETVCLRLLDSLIVGESSHHSLADSGMM